MKEKLDLISVPEGFFLMGSDLKSDILSEPDERPVQQVFLSNYKIRKTLVSIHEWFELLKKN